MNETMDELVVVVNRHVADHAGFRPDGRHRQLDKVMAWWPARGFSSILARRWQRVTLDSSVRHVSGQDRQVLSEAVMHLKTGQQVFGDRAVWMEF